MNSNKPTSRIVELARIITRSVTEIQDTLDHKGVPSPSFDENFPPLPRDVEEAQNVVLDATSELHDLLTEPINLLHQTARSDGADCIQIIVRFGIAGLIPPNSDVSFKEIAEQTPLTEQMTGRIIRHAALMHIFHEPQPGRVAHTNISRFLARMEIRNWMQTGFTEVRPAQEKLVDALERWPGSEEPHETGFALANNSMGTIYDILAITPGRATRFANALAVMTMKPEFDLSFALDCYDWTSLGDIQVVDVGGAQGHFAIALAKQYPRIRVIVQDMLSVVSEANAGNQEARVSFMAHDVFNTQTVRADVFFFRCVFHNWSDSYCVQILKAQIPALRYGNKLIVQESLMPEGGTMAKWKEMDIRATDLAMASLFNTRERTLADWKILFEKADPAFVLKNVIEPKGSALGILEFVWEGKNAPAE